MKRSIKFRAWVNTYDGKEMLYDYCFLELKENHFHAEDLTNDRPDVGEIFSVMQFTGLTDKNGKEIYEGDIVKCKIDEETTPPIFFITEIFYHDEFANFDLKNTYHEFDFLTCKEMEVIGNIHQNPELL